MALIPPSYLDAVVALGKAGSDGKTVFTASGFLYGHPRDVDPKDGRTLYTFFLVTNQHVVQEEDELIVQINQREGQPPASFRLRLRSADGSVQWTAHPSGADVAVVIVDASILSEHCPELCPFLGDKNVIGCEEASGVGIGEGDAVFILGFPLGLAGQERNYAIARHGILARVQDWLRGDSSTFLIDASIFPGNSGGPVITKPDALTITGTRSFKESRLIGIVAGFLPYRDVAVSKQTGKERVTFEENSGLAVVVPADAIRETVETALGKT